MHYQDSTTATHMKMPVLKDDTIVERSIQYRNEECKRMGYILVTSLGRGKRSYLACLGFVVANMHGLFPRANAHMSLYGERNTWEEAEKDLRNFLNGKDACDGK